MDPLDNLREGLKFITIINVLLISVLLVIATIGINIEGIAGLSSNNTFGQNVTCNAYNLRSPYYSCILNQTLKVYLPQYNVFFTAIAYLVGVLGLAALLLLISPSFKPSIKSIMLVASSGLLTIQTLYSTTILALYASIISKVEVVRMFFNVMLVLNLLVFIYTLTIVVIEARKNRKLMEMNKIKRIIISLIIAIIVIVAVMAYLISRNIEPDVIVAGILGPILGTIVSVVISLSVESSRKTAKDIWDHLYEIKEKCLTPLKYNIQNLGSDDGYWYISENTVFLDSNGIKEKLSLPVHTWDKGEGGIDFRIFAGASFLGLKKVVDESLYNDLKNHKLTDTITQEVDKVKLAYTKNMPLHLEAYEKLYSKIIENDEFKKISEGKSSSEKDFIFKAIYFSLWDIEVKYWTNVFTITKAYQKNIADISLSIKASKEYERVKTIEGIISKSKEDAIRPIDIALNSSYLRERCDLVKQQEY